MTTQRAISVSPPSKTVKVPKLEKPWLTIGNQKLGPIPTFNLLAGHPDHIAGGTCPGATTHCGEICYAQKGRLAFPSVKQRYAHNMERLVRPGGLEAFQEQVPAELIAMGARFCRIHSSGDFFQWKAPNKTAYVDAWVTIARGARRVNFLAYTRSWSVPSLYDAIIALSKEPNVQVFASIDESTLGSPPPALRHAYTDMDGPALPCLNQNVDRFGRKIAANCASCGNGKPYCFVPHHDASPYRGAVYFRRH